MHTPIGLRKGVVAKYSINDFTRKGRFMINNKDVVSLSLLITAQDDIDADELDRITRRLMTELENLEVESVTPVGDPSLIPGAKGADPVTIGALLIIVLQAALPKVLEFIQAWSLRNVGQTVKVKVQAKNRSVEVEYPKGMTPVDAQNHIQMVIDTLNNKG